MTDTQPSGTDPQRLPSTPAGRPQRRPTLGSRPGFWPTAALVGASFLLLFEFLAFQLRHGDDPALGGTGQVASPPSPRPVLVRHVVKTRVVADGTASSGASATSSDEASGSSSTVSAAPASAPAPAPAPAPAGPVVSSSS